MKLKLATLLFAFIAITNIKAQEKETSFQLEKGEAPIKIIEVDGKGLIIKSGRIGKYAQNSKKVNWHLRYFDLEMNLLWDKVIEKEAIGYDFDKITSSANGSKVYHIEKLNYTNGNFIKQISLDGTIKKYKVSKTTWKLLSKGNYKDYLANDNEFCFIFSKYGNELNPKKMLEEKLILNKVDFNTLSENTITLELPKVKTDPKETNFWNLSENDDEHLYFDSYCNDDTEKRISNISLNIAKMNYDGKLLKEINIQIKREDIAKVNSWDYTIDKDNNLIYVYGLEQLRLNVKENDQRNLFIMQFDYEGNLNWENKVEGISAGNGNLPVNVFIQKNKDVLLELKGRNIQVIWEFTELGAFIKNYATNRDELVRVSGGFIPTEGTPTYDYFKKCRSREHLYYSRNLNKSKDTGALVEFNDETRNVKVLKFKK